MLKLKNNFHILSFPQNTNCLFYQSTYLFFLLNHYSDIDSNMVLQTAHLSFLLIKKQFDFDIQHFDKCILNLFIYVL